MNEMIEINIMFSYVKSILVALSLLTTTVSFASNSEVSFPDPSKSYLKDSMRYEVSDILELDVGLDKDQVRHILGNPHFNEGVFSNKVWNYLVDIRIPNSQKYLSCQLRVDFDKSKLVEMYSWKGEQCNIATFQKIEEPKKQVVYVNAQDERGNVENTLKNASIYFSFDNSNLANVLNQKSLVETLDLLKSNNLKMVKIIGYADISGKSIYNVNLSRERALTIANYLVQNGIDHNKIQVEANGATEEFKKCDRTPVGTLDKSCNQPNRQVLISWN